MVEQSSADSSVKEIYVAKKPLTIEKIVLINDMGSRDSCRTIVDFNSSFTNSVKYHFPFPNQISFNRSSGRNFNPEQNPRDQLSAYAFHSIFGVPIDGDLTSLIRLKFYVYISAYSCLDKQFLTDNPTKFPVDLTIYPDTVMNREADTPVEIAAFTFDGHSIPSVDSVYYTEIADSPSDSQQKFRNFDAHQKSSGALVLEFLRL